MEERRINEKEKMGVKEGKWQNIRKRERKRRGGGERRTGKWGKRQGREKEKGKVGEDESEGGRRDTGKDKRRSGGRREIWREEERKIDRWRERKDRRIK